MAISRQTPWHRNAVIYEIYVRSFADANGDGIGDLAGVHSRLDYLRDLGIDAIWLTPYYRSPMVDGGYDIADYRDVDPRFGTLAQLDELIAAAHRRGLRLIIDIVPNHTSDQHPWFQQAIAAGPGSAARDRYHFRPGRGDAGNEPPNNWHSLFGGSAWTKLPDGEWYLHLFTAEQPDLNWDNESVRAEFADILRFWLDRGVDGIRVDVAHGLVKPGGLPDLAEVRPGERQYFDQENVHDIYRTWRRLLDSYDPPRMAVAEARQRTMSLARVARYARPDELDQAFNFDFLGTPWKASALRAVITESLAEMNAVGAPATWAFASHDDVRQPTRFGADDYAMGLRRARAAALLMLALPGVAYLYQGEELGLPEITDLADELRDDPAWVRSKGTRRPRDGCRIPLPWAGNFAPFGFSPPGSAAPWLPQPASWAELSVQAQRADPHSTLSLYRAALRIRRDHPALGGGELHWLDSPDHVLAFARYPSEEGLTRSVGVDGPSSGRSGLIPSGGAINTNHSAVICTVNCGDRAVLLRDIKLPGPLRPILASGPVDEPAELPRDTAIWWELSSR